MDGFVSLQDDVILKQVMQQRRRAGGPSKHRAGREQHEAKEMLDTCHSWYMGSAMPFSYALLRSAEQVYMGVHPGLARHRVALRIVSAAAGGERRGSQARQTLGRAFSSLRPIASGRMSVSLLH